MKKLKEYPIIPVDKETRITFDKNNCIIECLKIVKDEKRWVQTSFYPDMASLCTELLETLTTRSNKIRNEMLSVVEAVNEAKRKILKAIKKYNA